MSIANTAEDASPMRGLLPLWVGVGIYALSVLAGDQLLNDPTPIGRSRSVNGFSTIEPSRKPICIHLPCTASRGSPRNGWRRSCLAVSHSIAGWAGLVVLAATSIALTFALLVRFLSRHLTGGASLAFIATAVALVAGTCWHGPMCCIARHVAWVGGSGCAMDDRKAPSFWLLPLMALWANLHGGFVLGWRWSRRWRSMRCGTRMHPCEITGAALGIVRRRGAARKLPHALRMGPLFERGDSHLGARWT